MPHPAWWMVLVLVFLIGAWAGVKYPMSNLIGRVTG
jgi:hypothetical protein